MPRYYKTVNLRKLLDAKYTFIFQARKLYEKCPYSCNRCPPEQKKECRAVCKALEDVNTKIDKEIENYE